MFKPVLLVIAGCNGSGKSTFSNELGAGLFKPFDYDFHYLKNYESLLEIDIREQMAHNITWQQLENEVDISIKNGLNFCYETNFNSTPLHWPKIFKEHGYQIRMVYLCLNSIEEAIRRVAIRVENGGHFVPENEIRNRYFQGFDNLNSNFQFFDSIDLFETSIFGKAPDFILSYEKDQKLLINYFPDYLKELIPSLISISY